VYDLICTILSSSPLSVRARLHKRVVDIARLLFDLSRSVKISSACLQSALGKKRGVSMEWYMSTKKIMFEKAHTSPHSLQDFGDGNAIIIAHIGS
jgi:hypothetical protein